MSEKLEFNSKSAIIYRVKNGFVVSEYAPEKGLSSRSCKDDYVFETYKAAQEFLEQALGGEI